MTKKTQQTQPPAVAASIGPGTISVLRLLYKAPAKTADEIDRSIGFSRIHTIPAKSRLYEMTRRGMLRAIRASRAEVRYQITGIGVHVLKHGSMPVSSQDVQAALQEKYSRITNANAHGTYTGSELKAFTVRPGAMDAFSKPSVIHGQLVERRVG